MKVYRYKRYIKWYNFFKLRYKKYIYIYLFYNLLRLYIGEEMARYPAIRKRTLKNGTVNIYARIRHNGKNLGEKNFTKHFGCRTEKSAFEKLQEIKILISKGINPFEDKTLILNDLWEKKLLSANWRENTRSHYINYYDIVIRNTLGKKSINKINVQEILKLKNDYKHKSISYQNRIKSMLNPIFEEELIKGNITVNPFSNIKNQVAKSAKPVSQKSFDNELKIARRLLETIKKNHNNFINTETVKNIPKIIEKYYKIEKEQDGIPSDRKFRKSKKTIKLKQNDKINISSFVNENLLKFQKNFILEYKTILNTVINLNKLLDKPIKKVSNIELIQHKKILTVKDVELLYSFSKDTQKSFRGRIHNSLPYIKELTKSLSANTRIYYKKSKIEEWVDNFL